MDFLNYFTSLFYWSLKRKKKKKKTSRRSFRFPDPKKKFLHVVFLARGCISKSRFLVFFKPVSSTFSSLNVLHPASLSIFSPSTLTPTTAAQQGLGETLMYNVLMRNKRDATSSAHAHTHTHTHTLLSHLCVLHLPPLRERKSFLCQPLKCLAFSYITLLPYSPPPIPPSHLNVFDKTSGIEGRAQGGWCAFFGPKQASAKGKG